jgi:GABA permease
MSMNVLVLAASPVDASLLRRELGDDAEGAQVLVVSPAVNSSPLAFWVSDSDEAIEDAQERLDETLANLRSGGVQARGTTGDSEGLLAIQDALASFQADRVVVVDDPEVAGEAAERLDVPVVAAQST